MPVLAWWSKGDQENLRGFSVRGKSLGGFKEGLGKQDSSKLDDIEKWGNSWLGNSIIFIQEQKDYSSTIKNRDHSEGSCWQWEWGVGHFLWLNVT
jgi:hypothetical protein